MEAVAEKKTVGEGKFLTFVLSEEVYGIKIHKVREIMAVIDITPIPQSPDYLKGVINLRGKVIPVIDLRLKFSMPETEFTHETCIIVVEFDSKHIGIVVDSVSEVIEIKNDQVGDTPQFGQDLDTSFIMGLGKVKEKIIILLDIDNVLSSDELKIVEQSTSE
ncbi:MAG: chemotaxis protein CheW [Planctomycetes bacterium]|nr:chemotaxis protein CheW [Planctomycetota bacterium]